MAKMRPLFINAEALAKIAHVMEYAEEHPYHPDVDPVPGDVPGYVCEINTYTCVFTYTVSAGKRWRHLSISVPDAGKYPNPAAAFTLAKEFGFTGWDEKTIDVAPPGWICGPHETNPCVVLGQEIE